MLRAEPAAFRTHYRRQLHAETVRQRESDDTPVLLGALNPALLQTSDLAFSIEMQADGALVASWTGHYKRAWLEDWGTTEGDATAPRLWSVVPTWFSKLVAAAKVDARSTHRPDATGEQADPAFTRRYALSLYVTNGMRTVPLFRGVAPDDSEPERPVGGHYTPAGYPMLLHFAPEFSRRSNGVESSLPRLLKLGHDGKSKPTWHVYLLADGTVQLRMDLIDDEEGSIIDDWAGDNSNQVLAYFSLLIMRYA